MTSLPENPLRALVRQLVQKSDKTDKTALWLLVEHMASLPGQPEANVFPGGIPRDVIKLLAEQERDQSKLKEPRSIQTALARVFREWGVNLEPGGVWVEELLLHGLPKTIAQIKQDNVWEQDEVLAMAPHLLTTPYQRVLDAVEAWQNDPLLDVVGRAGQQVHLDTGWLKKGVTDSTLKLLRRDRDWSSAEAGQYLAERLWPDWCARQYSDKALEQPCAREFSSNGKSLIEQVPAQAWQQIVFSQPYNAKQAEIFPEIAQRLMGHMVHMDLPMPPMVWIDEDIATALPKTDKGVKPWSTYMGVKCLSAASASGDFGWGMVARALAYQSKVKGTKRISVEVLDHLAAQWQTQPDAPPPPSNMGPAIQHFADGAWIMSCPSTTLDAQLGTWVAEHENMERLAGYHEHIAHVSLSRLRKEANEDAAFSCPALSTCFWTHLLKAVGQGEMTPSKMLGELVNENAPGHAALWNIGPNEAIAAVVADGGLGEKRLGPDNQNMWRNILLKLQVETAPRMERNDNRRIKF